MNKRSLLGLLAALPLLMLSACGGDDDGDGTATIRLVNASPGYASLDMYADDVLVSSGVAFRTVGEFASVSGGSVVTRLTVAGSDTNLLSQTRTLGNNTAYTVVAFGWAGAAKSVILTENQEEAASGQTKFSVLHTAIDAGMVDVYLTAPTDSLDTATPLASDVQGGTQTGYVSVANGTMRLRVTAADNKSDVRLDVSGIELTSGQVATMILTPGSGGVLVDGLLLTQGGAVQPFLNTVARVRAVSAVSGGASVSVSVGGTSLMSARTSPAISDYALVTAGSAVPISGTVNGTPLAAAPLSIAAGADVTLLIKGSPAAADVSRITDDNRLVDDPLRAKIRVLNAVEDLASVPTADNGVSLVLDFTPVVSNVPYGTASDYVNVQASTSARLEVSSPLTIPPLYLLTDAPITPRAVYTVFMLGEMADAPQAGILRRER